ncbi:MAG: haloacid dehalogenase-like hydrolase [Oscillospiraceae bacterium]|nr:haloacid dehalogenase-like hydrolase [Oscillospiraceae bacterium]
MNIYDFDKTIFHPDSSATFFRYCLRTIPAAVLPTLPRTAAAALRYRKGKLGAKELKQQIFSFLSSVRDPETLVDAFWKKNEWRIGDWYLKQKRDDDLIISASPRFLLAPICEKLGVSLIATEMDPHTGQITGENCRDVEKPKRFRASYPDALVERFYSDSLSDAPMAELADEAVMVKKHRLFPWPK